jgi:hypothetical protein
MSISAVATAGPPEIAFTIDLHSNQDELNSQMKSACKQILSGWDALSDTNIEVSSVEDGYAPLNAVQSQKL